MPLNGNTVPAHARVRSRTFTVVVATLGCSLLSLASPVANSDVAHADASIIATIPANYIWDLTQSPDGRTLYALDIQKHVVRVIDSSNGTETATIPVDGIFGATVAYVNHHYVPIGGFDLGEGAVSIAITPDGSRLVIAEKYITVNPTAYNTLVAIVDIAQKKVVDVVPLGVIPQKVATNPASTLGYSIDRNTCTLSTFDVSLGMTKPVLSTSLKPTGSSGAACTAKSLVVADGGKRAYVGIYESGIEEIDLTMSPPVVRRTFPLPHAFSVFVTPNGKTIYVTTQDLVKGAYAFDVATGDPRALLGSIPIGYMTFNSGSTVAYTTGTDPSVITAYDLKTGAALFSQTIGGHPGPLLVSPDGHRLYSTDYQNSTITVLKLPKADSGSGSSSGSSGAQTTPSAAPSPSESSPPPAASPTNSPLAANTASSNGPDPLIVLVIGVLALLFVAVVLLIVLVLRRPPAPRG
jgi:DNA-binding beta-propeller fold protein YncE